jgi:hypothetical protein
MVEAMRILRSIREEYPAVFRAWELDRVLDDLHEMPMSATEEMIWTVVRAVAAPPEGDGT